VGLTYTVGTGALFTVTRLEEVKPVPEIVSVTGALPAGTLPGVIDWMARGDVGVGEVFWEEPPHPTIGRQKIAQ
jgi:hypothetical protein